MKNFFNVLYRRILYKIPLKWLLVLLAVLAVWFASFSNAWLVLDDSFDLTVNSNNQWTRYTNTWDFTCIVLNSCTRYANNSFMMAFDDYVSYAINLDFVWWTIPSNFSRGMWYCFTNRAEFYVSSSECNITMNRYKVNEYTSLQCQTEYSLIPISEVDSSYCQSNNLCPSWWTPSDCPNVWISNVFINDIFHPGAFNIIMNIPDEVDWDYAYTNSWNNLNIDIVWYNVDYEYMDWVVDIQTYKPNSDDFSVLVSQIVPLFVPWLCIILLLYFIFRFIKKIF